MITKETFMYDADLDRLMIFNNLKSEEKVQGSVKIFNLVLDITASNRIANVEIRNISEYLKSIGKDSSILDSMDSATIEIVNVRGGFLIQISLSGAMGIEKIPYTIPTEERMLVSV